MAENYSHDFGSDFLNLLHDGVVGTAANKAKEKINDINGKEDFLQWVIHYKDKNQFQKDEWHFILSFSEFSLNPYDLAKQVLKDITNRNGYQRKFDQLLTLKINEYAVKKKLSNNDVERMEECTSIFFAHAFGELCKLVYKNELDSSNTIQTALLQMDNEQFDNKYCIKLNQRILDLTPRAIWYAAERAYRKNSKFHSVKIEEILLGVKTSSKLEISGIHEEDQVSVKEFIKENDYTYIIGEGGIGKTTILQSVLEDSYGSISETDKNASDIAYNFVSSGTVIPMFIELAKAPDSAEGNVYLKGHSTYIRRMILKMLLDDQFADSDNLKDCYKFENTVVDQIIGKIVKQVHLFLLLDGLNEVQPVSVELDNGSSYRLLWMITEEINGLHKLQNVKMCLSSRTQSTEITSCFNRVIMLGLSEKSIAEYLEMQWNNDIARIRKTTANDKLMKTISIPLFLTMFASLNNSEEIATQGEIYKSFFHQSTEETYSQQRITRNNEKYQKKQGYAYVNDRMTASMEAVLLNFVLPEIAYTLEKSFEYYIDYEDIQRIAENTLSFDNSIYFSRKYGLPCFSSRYPKKYENNKLKSSVEMLKSICGQNFDYVLDYCCSSLGLLVEQDGEYKFFHETFRDYFAAVKYIRIFEMATFANISKHEIGTARKFLKQLDEDHLHPEVRRYIGEYTQEYKNAPYTAEGNWIYPLECIQGGTDRTLLSEMLDVIRNAGEDNFIVSIWNILTTVNESRGELSGMNLSYLDLKNFSFYNVRLSRIVSETNKISSKINCSLLKEASLYKHGHSGAVRTAKFSKDCNQIVTSSEDNTAKIWNVATGELEYTLSGHAGCVHSAEFSFDNRRIVTASYDGTAKIWNAVTGELEHTLNGHTASVNSAKFSADGSRILTDSDDKTVKIWNTVTGELEITLNGHTETIFSSEFSADGSRIVTASADETAKIWNAATGELEHTLSGHTTIVCSAEFSGDGRRIVTASEDGTAKIWNTATGELELTLSRNKLWIDNAKFSADGNRIVTVSNGGKVKIWNAITGELEYTLSGHTGSVTSAEISPDDSRIVTTSIDGTARIWNTATGELEYKLSGHTDIVCSAEFSEDGSRIVTASDDGTARIWNTATGELEYTLSGYTSCVNYAEFSTDCSRLVTSLDDGTANIWNTQTWKLEQTLSGHKLWMHSAKFCLDGSRIVTASIDGTAKIWNVATGELEHTLSVYASSIGSAEFSRDGSKVVTSLDNGTAIIWNSTSGKQDYTLIGHTDCVNSAKFNTDGSRIVTASDDGTAKIWNSITGEQERTIFGHTNCVNNATFSLDGSRIVTKDDDGIVKVWNSTTGDLELTLSSKMSHDNLQLSADGSRIVTTSCGKVARIWNATTGELLQTLSGHTGLIYSVDFSSYNSKIVTASQDGTAKIWNTATGELLQTLSGHTGPVFEAKFNADDSKVITASSDGTARIWNTADWSYIVLPNVPGLLINGVDFSKAHFDDLSDEVKQIMIQYGAKF